MKINRVPSTIKKQYSSRLSSATSIKSFTQMPSIFSILILIALSLKLACVQAQVYQTQITSTTISEETYYGGIFQSERTFNFFTLTVSVNVYDGSQYLIIKAMAESYGSDPDLFISKSNIFPINANMSDYYCLKEGSDTCVIPSSNINAFDSFYIGVRCIEGCTYGLSTTYQALQTLTDSTAALVISNGHSSSLFSYYVPASASDGFTSALTLSVVGDDTYRPIDIYLSTTSNIYQIEEKLDSVVLSKGTGIKYTSNDYYFCTQCTVYFLVDVVNSGKYYFTAAASARNNQLYAATIKDQIINAKQSECYQYYISKATSDVTITVNQYTGSADLYLSVQSYPQTMTDKSVAIVTNRNTHRILVASVADRTTWGVLSGLYYICLNAYEDTSFNILVNEITASTVYAISDNQEMNVRIQNASNVQFQYTSADLAYPCMLQVTLTGIGLTNSTAPPRIFYKLCVAKGSCTLSSAEAQGQSNQTAAELGKTNTNYTRIAYISHDPSTCSDPTSCYYAFSAAQNNTKLVMQIGFLVNHTVQNSQSVSLSKQYVNIIEEGFYQYYTLLPSANSNMQYMVALQINLASEQGDADLFVSTVSQYPNISNYEYKSRKVTLYDQVTLNSSVEQPVLNIPIYISVFAAQRVSFYLTFSPFYEDTYNTQLIGAFPLIDSQGLYCYMSSNYDSRFMSFTPWWTGAENMTIVFTAQMVFNNIYMYASADSYPVSTLSQWQGKNNTMVVRPGAKGYSFTSTYYIKVVPNFALYDVVATKQFIFYYFAFAQPQNTSLIDLQINDKVMGYVNASHMFYRHFMESPNGTYVFTVNPIYGNPTLMIGISSTLPMYPTMGNYSSFFFIQNMQTVGKVNVTQQNLSSSDRIGSDSGCQVGNAGYYLGGGNTKCTFYIGVYCPSSCVYNISIQLQGSDNSTTIPKYLLENKYYTGVTKVNQSHYFYYPVTTTTGEISIFLNKTWPSGYQNGDLALSMVVINDTSKGYSSWSLPNWYYYMSFSWSGQSTQPELIEICGGTFSQYCASNQSCAVLIGVHSRSLTLNSHFRLKIVTDRIKLTSMKPVKGVLANAGDYQYYYFTNNITVFTPSAYWEFLISASILSQGGDVDLFVSAIDARNPTSDDYDFASQNNGPEDIVISSNNTQFFDKANYALSNGLIFVVGVKALTSNVTYSLLMAGPRKFNFSYTELNITSPISATFLNATKKRNASATSSSYRWFNYGAGDFQIQVDNTAGQVYVFLNYYSEQSYLSNIYQSIPINENNSLWSAFVNTSTSTTVRIYKDGTPAGLFCYYCWYYITVMTNYTVADSSYQVSIQRIADSGTSVTQLALNTQQSVTLGSAGTITQYKFIFDNQAPFTLSAIITSGTVAIYVGLYPDAPTTKAAWSVSGSVGTQTISVKQTDYNFHIGSWYYVTMVAINTKATLQLTISQYKNVKYLNSYVLIKDQYWTEAELVKYYFFLVPTGTYKVTMNIQGLTNDFYPVLTLNKAKYNSTPSDFRLLNYSSFQNYTQRFGDNVTYILNQNYVNIITYLSNSYLQFSYSFIDNATTNYTYQMITMYANTYGLNDQRKHQFELEVQIENYSTTTGKTVSTPVPIYTQEDIEKMNIIKADDNKVEETKQSYVMKYAQKWFQKGGLIGDYFQ